MGLFPKEFKKYDTGHCGWCGGSCDECLNYSGDCHNKNKVCINDVELSFNYIIRNEHWGILECKLRNGDAIERWERSMGHPKRIVIGDCWFSCSPLMYKLKWDDVPICFKRGKSNTFVKIPKDYCRNPVCGWWENWDVRGGVLIDYNIDCPNCCRYNIVRGLRPSDVNGQGIVTRSEYYCGHCGFGGNLKLEGWRNEFSKKIDKQKSNANQAHFGM